nr:uncharacterized protein LOC109159550 [Ipomoea batatas]
MESPKHRILGGSSAINVDFYSKANDVSTGAQEWTIGNERLFVGMDSFRDLLLLWDYAQIYSFSSLCNRVSDRGIKEASMELEIGRFVPIFLHHSTLPLTIH